MNIRGGQERAKIVGETGQLRRTMSSSETGSDKMNPVVKPNAFPIDLAQKIALVKPTDSKGATVQAHPFRCVFK